MRSRHAPLLLATCVFALSSCMGPVSLTSPVSRPIAAAETTLIFHTTGTQRAFADRLAAANYLALELKLLSDGTQKSFATATKDGSGDFVVTIPGLVAGDWRLRAFFYDSETAGNLLLYARQTEYLAPGQVRSNIVLALYEPGSVGSGVPATGLDADHVAIDPNGADHSSPSTPRTLEVGNRLKLMGTVYSSVTTGVPDEYELADDQTLLWSSSSPDVATVSSSGTILAREPGFVTISANSMENAAARQDYFLRVVPGLEGSWKKAGTATNPSNEVFRFHQGRWTYFQWDSKVDPDNYDPSSMVMRGTYTLDGDRALMVTEAILLPGSVDWVPWAPGYDIPRYLPSQYSVSGNQLILFVSEMSSGSPKAVLDSGGSGDKLNFELQFSGVRVFDDPLTAAEVTLDSLFPDGTGAVAATVGDTINVETTLGLATIDQVVWVSSDPTVLNFENDGYVEGGSVSVGTATLRAYALDALDYEGTLASSGVQPLITLSLTVTAPPDTTGPTITTSDLSAAANYQATFPFTFQVYISDPSGLGGLMPSITIDSGYIVPDSITDVGGGTFNVEVPATGSGTYSVVITAQDSLGNSTTETFYLEVLSI